MNNIVLKSFIEEYTVCLNELVIYFDKNPTDILKQQEYRSFLPESKSINKEDAAIYAFDLILLHLFLDSDFNSYKTAEHLLNVDIFKKYYTLFNNKFKFYLKNTKKQEDNSISPEIISIIGEMQVNNLDNILKINSGGVFTPVNDIRLMCFNALFYFIQANSDLQDEVIVKLLNSIKSGKFIPFSSVFQKISFCSLINSLKVLDPACGTGKFQVEILEIIYKLLHNQSNNIPAYLILKNNIYGVDFNPQMIFKSKILLYLKSVELENRVLDADLFEFNIVTKNTLTDQIFPENEKFEIIIGNPPYVRQENINNKDEIIRNIKKTLNLTKPINKRSDLYIYFFYIGFHLLKPNGILSFLTSNSWLNIGFGFEFQKYLLDKSKIIAIIDNNERTFDIAEINTVITFFCKKPNETHNNPVHFIKFLVKNDKEKFDIPIFWNIERLSKKYYKIRSIKQAVLTKRGLIKSDYKGSRWGNLFFMAPDVFFKIENLLGKELLRLGDLAKISRGITTGLNKYFLLEKISENDGESDLMRVRNGFNEVFHIENEFLQPIITSPKIMNKPNVAVEKIKFFLLNLDPFTSKSDLSKFQVIKYLNYGENLEIPIPKGRNKGNIIRGVKNIPSLKNKKFWPSFETTKSSKNTKIFVQKIFSTAYKVLFLSENHDLKVTNSKIICNNTFYNISIYPEYAKHKELIKGSLLSTLMYISIELNARRNFGAGALDTATFDIENILILNPELVHGPYLQKITELSDTIANREFLELKEEFKDRNRNELDLLILTILGFDNPKEIRDELYKSLLKITNERLKKAQTFRKKGK